MDRNFARSLSLVLRSEGGWSDNPADNGGATMKGVTLANFRRYVKPDGTKADLRAISDDQVATVYRKFYWDTVSGDQLPDGVDYAVLDFGVNSGPERSVKYLQAACGVGVIQDGKIGPATLAAVRAKSADDLINTICDARLKFLERLPTWPTFGRGWGARVASVRAEALKMAAQPQASPPASVQPATAPVQTAPPPVTPVPPAQAPEPPVVRQGLPPVFTPKVPIPAPPAAKPAATIGIIGALILVLASWWHDITAWLSSIF